jgi:hypothetical protein
LIAWQYREIFTAQGDNLNQVACSISTPHIGGLIV